MLRLPPLLLLSPVFAAACTDYASLCSRNDPSMTAEACWNAGYDDGFTTASHDAYDAAYDEGYAACEADYVSTSSLVLVLLAAVACRETPDNSIGKACVANKETVSLHDCWLAGHEQGVDVGATAPGYGYDDGYQVCLDEHDTGDDSGG